MNLDDLTKMMLNPSHIDDIPDDAFKKAAKNLEAAVTFWIGFLREKHPNEAVRDLMKDVWELVGLKITPASIGPVPTVSIAAIGPVSYMLFPENWLAMVKENLTMQLGALVFVGSQLVDSYNGRLVPVREVINRARAYEAQYLLSLKKAAPEWEANEYQLQLLHKFPEGLDSPPVVLYKHKPVVKVQS